MQNARAHPDLLIQTLHLTKTPPQGPGIHIHHWQSAALESQSLWKWDGGIRSKQGGPMPVAVAPAGILSPASCSAGGQLGRAGVRVTEV